jgi:holliday junction DNA helicase RuvA
MIGRLRGQLLDKRAPWLLLEVAGVGYEVEAPMTVFYQLPEPGQEVVLFTHFVVREDAQLLYGFCSRFERELFRALIRVNGVGPKLALAILSGMEAERLVRCIESQDSSTLVKIPGVGKKTAERLLIEMSDRLAKLDGVPTSLPGMTATAAPLDAVADAVAALESLGYRLRDAQAAVAKVADAETLSSEMLIRQALKGLAR